MEMTEDLLLQVNKPGRYIGGEWNTSKKDFSSCQVKFGLAFADLYEVGMSNLGVRILYGVLNNLPDTCCERFFCPGTDLEEKLRANNSKITSLESARPMTEFDLVGFSLASELGFTNVLNMLELAGLPLNAQERGNSLPLVIGGGPCALNPEPLHEFFDLFVIGEAEDAICEIVDLYARHKQDYRDSKISKQDLLLKLCQIEGVYVPSFYEVEYDRCGRVLKFSPKLEGVPGLIKKRFVEDFDKSFFPTDWLVPYIQIVHDRVSLEIMRGCPNRCRFCQARSQYYPLRIKSQKRLLSIAKESYDKTGYEEFSLIGLSVSDYPQLEGLLREMFDYFRPKAVSVSLPSVKVKEGLGKICDLIAGVKKTGLTFAPEAGTEKMRQLLAKDFDEKSFFSELERSYLAGYQHIKLYFMIGLPGESEEDLEGIIKFANDASELRRKISKPPAQVNISINTLIPKPHTPFQWLAMPDLKIIQDKQDYLRHNAKNKRLTFNFHNRHMSFVEAIFSRGDRRLARVLFCAFKKGARFDAWINFFDFEKWSTAFKEEGIEPSDYLRQRGQNELLPWDFIDTGVDKKYLLSEFNKVLQ